MAGVVLEDLSKVYPDGTTAVSGLDLAIDDGEFLVLVGPSGCGKTTALRMVAGLEDISAGQVRIGGGWSTGWRPRTATSPWCSRTMPCTPTSACARTWASG